MAVALAVAVEDLVGDDVHVDVRVLVLVEVWVLVAVEVCVLVLVEVWVEV